MNTTKPIPRTIGLILAGGQGARMGGQDKGWVVWREQALIKHVFDRLAPQVCEVLISANRNHVKYQQLAQVISDSPGNKGEATYHGPLAGICAAMQFLQQRPADITANTALLITPCDTPTLPSDLAIRLRDALANDSADVSVVFDGTRVQSLHCMISAGVWDKLLEFYAQGNLALRDWFTQVVTQQVDFSDCAERFENFNRLSDLNPIA